MLRKQMTSNPIQTAVDNFLEAVLLEVVRSGKTGIEELRSHFSNKPASKKRSPANAAASPTESTKPKCQSVVTRNKVKVACGQNTAKDCDVCPRHKPKNTAPPSDGKFVSESKKISITDWSDHEGLFITEENMVTDKEVVYGIWDEETEELRELDEAELALVAEYGLVYEHGLPEGEGGVEDEKPSPDPEPAKELEPVVVPPPSPVVAAPAPAKLTPPAKPLSKSVPVPKVVPVVVAPAPAVPAPVASLSAPAKMTPPVPKGAAKVVPAPVGKTIPPKPKSTLVPGIPTPKAGPPPVLVTK